MEISTHGMDIYQKIKSIKRQFKMENTEKLVLPKGLHYHHKYPDYLNRSDLFYGQGISPLKLYWVHKKREDVNRVIFVRIGDFYEFYHNDADVMNGFGCPYMYGSKAYTGIPASVAEKYTQLLTVNCYKYTFMDHYEAKGWFDTMRNL